MPSANILLVDDEKITRKLVGDMLSGLGLHVQTAGAGEQALDLFARGLFDVVVSDVNMPGMDGIEMVRRMRASDPTVVPVIMTTRHDQETAVRALECGVKGFLVKPFSQEELRAKIEEALQERRRIVDTRMLVGDLIRARSDLQQKVVEQDRQLTTMEEQLLYAEQLSLLGQLAPRIAHEFKTPLQLIHGHAELALTLLKSGKVEQAQSSVERILPSARQMVALVQQMADLGRPAESRREGLDLRAELEETLEVLGHLGAVKYCQVVKDFEDPLPRVQGDPAQVEQVFRNLIVNAAQAMEGAQRRALTLGLKASPDGRWVVLTVGDTGPGIPERYLERIFHPFFTTKPKGKGTGLGLPIVKTVLDRHGAAIRVESELGEGARFIVSFPALQEG